MVQQHLGVLPAPAGMNRAVDVAALVNMNRCAPNLASYFEGDICWSDGVIRHHTESVKQETLQLDDEQRNSSGSPFLCDLVGPAGLEPATSGL